MSQSINIRPGVGVLALFPHMNYKPWYALGELVDNALASYQLNKDALARTQDDYQFRVVIEFDGYEGGSLRVWDNAAGIAQSDYERAFVTAEPPPDDTGLSQFGIGMKSASCWFAKSWSVRTKALGEQVERTIEFDVPRIVQDDVELLEAEEHPSDSDKHYTELRLWNLNHPVRGATLAKIKDHLASMYRVFLRRGDMRLKFNDEWLAFVEPAVLLAARWNDPDSTSVRWKKDLNFGLPTGEFVSGFAAIRETGSTSKAGFALFRNERLVVGSADETYRPPEIFGASNKFRYQRVFGELHLEGFEVSHTKDGFIWGDREAPFLEALRKELDDESFPLLRQAENYRVRANIETTRSITGQAVTDTAAVLVEAVDLLEKQSDSEPDDTALPETAPAIETASARLIEIKVRDQLWSVAVELSDDESVTDWLSLSDDGPAAHRDGKRHLSIRVSMTHPFMVNFMDVEGDVVEPLLRVATALGLAEIAARDAGGQMVGMVRKNVNQLLHVLASREDALSGA